MRTDVPYPRAAAAGNVLGHDALRIGRHLGLYFAGNVEAELFRRRRVGVVVGDAEGAAALLGRQPALLPPGDERNGVGDAPILPELLAQITMPIATVTGDGAYDTKACHAAIAAVGAAAIIPSRKNARLWKKYPPGAESRIEIVKATHRLGRAIWKRWSGYHRRSLVETKMRCLKLLGERIMARDFDRQVAELQVRAALLNRFTQLGTPDTVAMP